MMLHLILKLLPSPWFCWRLQLKLVTWRGFSCFNCDIDAFPHISKNSWVSNFFGIWFFFFLLNRNSLVLVMCLDWRMCGVKKTSNSRNLIFFSYQKILWQPHTQLVHPSLMGEKLERTLEMIGHLTRRCQVEIHSMEEDGPIFCLLLMSCEYQCIILSNKNKISVMIHGYNAILCSINNN